MSMRGSVKGLVLGTTLIVLVGIGGLVYRNAVEHANRPIACPVDAKVCPDGTSVARTGLSCTFPTCPPPNISLEKYGIAFALPTGYVAQPIDAPVAAYIKTDETSTTTSAGITIRQYLIAASSTALATIQASAIGGASGAPIPATGYSSTNIGQHHFTVVEIERFEGVIDTAYYLSREGKGDVLRFDAIDRGADWTNPALDVAALPAHKALLTLLATLQGD
jgi:hypothetical protein